MLYWLAQLLGNTPGPFRLFNSYLFLAGLGVAGGAFLTWWLLPRLWSRLPRDRGRSFAVGSEMSIGKPVGAGAIFIPIFILVSLLVVPFDWRIIETLAIIGFAMLVGLVDDRTPGGLSEYVLGLIDLVIALLAAAIVCQLQDFTVWLPLYKEPLIVSPWWFVPLATGLVWVSINATNCTDGVDGLSASLSAMSLLFLGIILYVIVGHSTVSAYLLVPHYPEAADWGMLAFVLIGVLAGYLWHNSFPSAVLMGDAGSRPIGLMIGVLVLATGNPFLILVVALVILVNGATGLVKVALLRFFKIGIFRQIRYPLHDHMRQNLNWSPTQVLVRFMILQALLTPILLVLLLKVR